MSRPFKFAHGEVVRVSVPGDLGNSGDLATIVASTATVYENFHTIRRLHDGVQIEVSELHLRRQTAGEGAEVIPFPAAARMH